MALIVDIFPCLSDNYGYLAHDGGSGRTAAVDAPEPGPILDALRRRGWTLTDILITHHHADHTQGIAGLKQAFPEALVTGPAAEKAQISGLERLVSPGDSVELGATSFAVIGTPGHTLGHVAYAAPGHLFSADALFSLGVGRMFEGAPGPMWAGLLALRALPDDTLVHCGHEYTQSNARFALSVDPDNATLKQRAAEVDRLRAEGKPTIPVPLGREKLTNPFLRADEPDIAARMGLDAGDPAAVFGALRRAKDQF